MSTQIKYLFAFLLMTAGIVLNINSAFAHSFNVSIVFSPSNTASFPDNQFVQGFLLATKEQDSHPDQESDGHLGGLDVYIDIMNGQKELYGLVKRSEGQNQIDILVAFEEITAASPVRELINGNNTALMLPGKNPFENSDLQTVIAFVSAYEKEYGTAPTSLSAQGYNAARRIEIAVRAQEGADDKNSLAQNFQNTKSTMNW